VSVFACEELCLTIYCVLFYKVCLVGPGNNGADALVAARHLKHFGYNPIVVMPKKPSRELYIRLCLQCTNLSIAIYDTMEQALAHANGKIAYNVILDGIFGFSFSGQVREPFKSLIATVNTSEALKHVPLVSIDIPSGWNVETGPSSNDDDVIVRNIDTLVSLTAPKLCAKHFKGRAHYIGGRFIPHSMQEQYELNLPAYKGTDIIVKL